MLKKTIVTMLACIVTNLQAQKRPKLVVGIVVDQMRYDYLLRFKEKFGNKGFNKLLKEGTFYENAHYNYIPTFTAVGHASIYTGTTPQNHGIIANNWYDKSEKKSIYVVDDFKFKTVGSTSNQGKKSPYRLVASTVADQLKISQNFKGKTIGIAIKDRSAILPVGHTADIAYWFDGNTNGKWITSSYYTKQLPNWVTLYNQENKTKLDTYLASPWVTKLKLEAYTECSADNHYFERTFNQEDKPIFPHLLSKLKAKNGHYSLLKTTPYGNTITLDFAKQIVKNEKLGKNKRYSDFLAISLSSTDYIGHKFGPASVEIQDTYLRLNDDLDDFINYLNKKVGKNHYVLFLTADHAVVQIPHYLMDHKAPGGYFSTNELYQKLIYFTFQKYQSTQLIENISNQQIFLNIEELKKLGLNKVEVEQAVVNEIINYKDIYKAVTATTLQQTTFTNAPLSLLQQGYNQKLSGNVLFDLQPTIIGNNYIKGGTTHGTGYNYDTHIPILFYGAGINQGKKVKKPVVITQIAPTLSNLLQIQEPNMSCTEMLTEVFKDKN